MRALALIQARVNSSRLPRKSLAVIGARASVFHVWKRAEIATGERMAAVVVPADDLGDFSAVLPPWALMCTDSPENDVLTRLAEASTYNPQREGADIIVRLTGDCPFVDPDGIRAVVKAVEDGADYARLWPIPNGLDAEAFPAPMLQLAYEEATDPEDREHVTPWIRRNAKSPVDVPIFEHLPRYRWTLDTAEDLELLRDIAAELGCTPPHPTVPELLGLLERRPDLARLDT